MPQKYLGIEVLFVNSRCHPGRAQINCLNLPVPATCRRATTISCQSYPNVELDFDAEEFKEFDEVGTGVPVATAPIRYRAAYEGKKKVTVVPLLAMKFKGLYGPVAIRT
jgi:hypothetical protein